MDKLPYIRIGTDYFKFVNVPLASKDANRILRPWTKQEIRQDHGGSMLSKIPKYDSYCIIPDNINYKRIHGEGKGKYQFGSYNLYEPILYEPKDGTYSKTLEFLKHIFGEQLDLGLDYLTIIYRKPMQVLPILCLVSKERKTGKTTFLNWLKLIYGANMTINTDEDFRNQFNSGWTSKLIVGGEEISLNQKPDVDKLKNLSTAKSIKSESKGKDKIESQFFGKIILCSNHEEDFVKIEPDEIRFWVRKIPSINKEIPDFDRDYLENEIPAFLYFLKNRDIKSPKVTRMWFTREQIYTTALQKLINGSESRLEREIKEIISNDLIVFDLSEIHFTLTDIINRLKNVNVRAGQTEIKEIFQKWRKTPPTGTRKYKSYILNQNTGMQEITTLTGRCYNFKKEEFI